MREWLESIGGAEACPPDEYVVGFSLAAAESVVPVDEDAEVLIHCIGCVGGIPDCDEVIWRHLSFAEIQHRGLQCALPKEAA